MFLLRGRQGGRRFVENHDPRVPGKGLRDLDHLAQTHGKPVHQRCRGEVDADPLQRLSRLAVHDPVRKKSQRRSRRPVQVQVFGKGHVQKEVQLLVDERDPRLVGIHGAPRVKRHAVQQHFAAVPLQYSTQDVHHGGFPGAVFSDETQDRAFFPQCQVDVLQYLDAGEALVELPQLQDGHVHGSTPPTVSLLPFAGR